MYFLARGGPRRLPQEGDGRGRVFQPGLFPCARFSRGGNAKGAIGGRFGWAGICYGAFPFLRLRFSVRLGAVGRFQRLLAAVDFRGLHSV